MTRNYLVLSLLLVITACNNSGTDTTSADTTNKETPIPVDTPSVVIPTPTEIPDSLLLKRTIEITTFLDKKDYTRLADFFHPTAGVRFTPYGYIDTTQDIKFTKDQFLTQLKNKSKQHWGSYDGSGDPIKLNVEEYLKKFVYDVKFLKPEQLSVNKTLGQGNSLDNLSVIYPDASYTESYFSGFDKKYGGMDWRSLKLVFKQHGGQIYLVGVIHGQWTI
jgi:hypothetical protein